MKTVRLVIFIPVDELVFNGETLAGIAQKIRDRFVSGVGSPCCHWSPDDFFLLLDWENPYATDFTFYAEKALAFVGHHDSQSRKTLAQWLSEN